MESLHRCAQQLLNLRRFEQTVRCFLQRGVVRDGLESQIAHEIRHVLQQRDHAAVILALMGLQHEQCEELVLGELAGAEPGRVSRQRRRRDRQRFHRHLPW